MSTPPATFSANSPSCSVPIEQACSTTSSPRNTSPSASASVLPCSALSVCAIRLMCSRTSAWSLSMMRARAAIGVFFQVLNACLGRGHRGVDFGIGRERHLRKHLLRRRVDDVVPFVGLRFDELAVEQHFDGRRLIGAQALVCLVMRVPLGLSASRKLPGVYADSDHATMKPSSALGFSAPGVRIGIRLASLPQPWRWWARG